MFELPGSVLLIGGPSAVGKSTIAKEIALIHGVNWIQVDDLRLALQWSNAILPEKSDTDALYFFERSSDVCDMDSSTLRDALIAVGEVMANAIAIVAANHITLKDSGVIEGDAILPSILDHPILAPFRESGILEVLFLLPRSIDDLRTRHIARGRGVEGQSEDDITLNVAKDWLFAQWLENEARARGATLVSSSLSLHPGNRSNCVIWKL